MKEINRERFEAWLFSQPKDRNFDYTNPRDCAICAFLKETTNVKTVLSDSTSTEGYSTEKAVEVGKVFSIETPQWLDGGSSERGVVWAEPLTIENMQKRYLELFPDSNPTAFIQLNLAQSTDSTINQKEASACRK